MTETGSTGSKPGRRRGCLRLMGKGLLVLVGLIVVLVPLGVLYQSRALRRDQARFPPPGRLVDVDGFRLHLYCQGRGSPTVILEAGLGDGAFIWSNLIASISAHTQVCAYDRPGLGWSDFVRQPFDRNAVAAHLHTLLVNAGVPGPYILVGHSIGGLYIRSFTHQFPEEVAGLVFVDSAHENQSGRTANRRSGAGRTLDQMLSLCEVIAPTGVFRLFGLGDALMDGTGLPPDVRQAAAATLNRSTYCRTIANELNTSDADTSLPSPPEKLGDIPLAALVAGQDVGGPPGGSPSGNSNNLTRLSGSRWLRLQQELAGLSTHGRLVIAENSSHYIHLDQPDLVIQAVLDVLEIARQK